MSNEKITFPNFEEYRRLVKEDCRRSYPDDIRLMEYCDSNEGIEDLLHDYRGYREYFDEGFAYGKRITDPEQFIRNRVSASAYNLFMSAE